MTVAKGWVPQSHMHQLRIRAQDVRCSRSAVGATNIFADLPKGWDNVAWEKVVEADPDVIVLADASWSTAASKQAYLESDPVLSQLKAVKNKAYVTIPFSESTPGIRLVDGAISVSEQLAKS